MLKGRKILVTGASRGIGLAAARALLAEGALVMGTASDPARLQQAARELGGLGDFFPVAADLREAGAETLLAAAVAGRWGSLDGLVNNAALNQSAGDISVEPCSTLERTFQVNLFAPHRLIQALLPLLQEGLEPRVLNVSSEAGQRKNMFQKRGDPGYCLSKYALNGLTQLWSASLLGSVAVNAMHPGWVRSDMGGPQATDPLEAGAKRILQALEKPFSETGKFWFGEGEFAW